jgi:hypothetical protein
MRTIHQSGALQMLGATPRQLRLDGALRLQADRSGWLWVDGGRVWVTRDGEGVDHVLAGRDALFLGRGDGLVAEPWRAGQAVGLHWAQADDVQALSRLGRVEAARAGRPAGAAPLAAAWRALAVALRGTAGRLAAAARSADARACRAQGSICAGDSIAASGALQ